VDKPVSKVMYLLKPQTDNVIFKVGRANDQDIKINDISSSRNHA
jgi:hypothetical protein